MPGNKTSLLFTEHCLPAQLRAQCLPEPEQSVSQKGSGWPTPDTQVHAACHPSRTPTLPNQIIHHWTGKAGLHVSKPCLVPTYHTRQNLENTNLMTVAATSLQQCPSLLFSEVLAVPTGPPIGSYYTVLLSERPHDSDQTHQQR